MITKGIVQMASIVGLLIVIKKSIIVNSAESIQSAISTAGDIVQQANRTITVTLNGQVRNYEDNDKAIQAFIDGKVTAKDYYALYLLYSTGNRPILKYLFSTPIQPATFFSSRASKLNGNTKWIPLQNWLTCQSIEYLALYHKGEK